MQRQMNQNLNRLAGRRREGSARRELHQVRWKPRIADQINHSGLHSSPGIRCAFFLRELLREFFPALARALFDALGFWPTASSNSATAISSSRVLWFGLRRRYSSLKAR